MAQSLQKRSLTAQKTRTGQLRTNVQSRKSHNVTTASISESISREDLHGLPNYKDTTAFLNSKDVFFTNLVLLGFDPLNYEEKYKIPFTRDMFDQNNRKGMEVVMHYLFTRLSPQRSKQAFKDCWPIFDKKQEQQFRKACAQWLAQIGKDDPSSRLPPIAASLLLTPGGTRFYQLMFYFSTYVVKVDLGRITGSEDVAASVALPKEIPKDKSTRVIMGRALQARIVLNQQKAVKLLEDWSKMNQDTREYVSKLVGEYRSIMKKRREIERELSSISEAKREEVIKRLNIEIPSGKNWEEMRRSIEEAFERDLAERSARVRQQWKQFEELYQKSEKQRAVMNSVLSGSEKEYELKGEELALKIPEVLLQNGDLKEKLGGENTYEDGKVNLLAFMRIWKLSLLELQKKLSESADVTKEGSVDASKHLDRLLEEQDKSRKKAEDLCLEMKELSKKLATYIDDSTAKILDSMGPGSSTGGIQLPSPVKVAPQTTSKVKRVHYSPLRLPDEDETEEESIRKLGESLRAKVQQRTDKKADKRASDLLEECMKALESDPSSQSNPSIKPSQPNSSIKPSQPNLSIKPSPSLTNPSIKPSQTNPSIKPSQANPSNLPAATPRTKPSAVKQLNTRTPQVQASQLVWERSGTKDPRMHAMTTSKKPKRSIQRERQLGHLDTTLPVWKRGARSNISTEEAHSSTRSYRTPLTNVTSSKQESHGPHKKEKAMKVSPLALHTGHPPEQRGQPKLEPAHEILVNEIVSDLVSAGVEPGSTGSDMSLSLTPEIHAVADPVAAFGQEAFTTRDKLARTPPTAQAGESPSCLNAPNQSVPSVSFLSPREEVRSDESLRELLKPGRTSKSPLSQQAMHTPSRLDGSIHLEFYSGQLSRSGNQSRRSANLSTEDKEPLNPGKFQQLLDLTNVATPHSSLLHTSKSHTLSGVEPVDDSGRETPSHGGIPSPGENSYSVPPVLEHDSLDSSHMLSVGERESSVYTTPPSSSSDNSFVNISEPEFMSFLQTTTRPSEQQKTDDSHSSGGSESTIHGISDEFLPSEPPTPFRDATMMDEGDEEIFSAVETDHRDHFSMSPTSVISSLHGQLDLSRESSPPSISLADVSIPQDNLDDPRATILTGHTIGPRTTPHAVVSSGSLLEFTPTPQQHQQQHYSSVVQQTNLSNDTLLGDISPLKGPLWSPPSSSGGYIQDLLTGTPRVAVLRTPLHTSTTHSTTDALTQDLLTGTPCIAVPRTLIHTSTTHSTAGAPTQDLLTGTPHLSVPRTPLTTGSTAGALTQDLLTGTPHVPMHTTPLHTTTTHSPSNILSQDLLTGTPHVPVHTTPLHTTTTHSPGSILTQDLLTGTPRGVKTSVSESIPTML